MRKNCFLLGDIHGSPEPIIQFYEENNGRLDLDHCDNTIILPGDVGVNYYVTGNRDYKLKKTLTQYPFTYICLRGNHESRVSNVIKRYPENWKSVRKYGNTIYVEKEFPEKPRQTILKPVI